MHIIHCLTHSDQGGGQEVVFILVSTLTRLFPELRTTVILPPNGVYVDRFRKLGVAVVEFPFDRISLTNIIKLHFLLRKLKPDVIHSHGKGAGFYTRIHPRALLHSLRVHSHHGFHPPNKKAQQMLYYLLESYLTKHTDILVAVSQSEADEVARAVSGSNGKVRFISNVIDCNRIRENFNRPINGRGRKFLDQHAHSHIVTMIARNDPVKNYPLAFDSCRIALERNKGVAFVFVGVDDRDGNFRNLKDSYPNNILGLPFIENTAMLINRSWVVLLTAKKEGCPLVILEAFCAGKPVIGTNVDGIKDLVTHRGNGLLCDGNPSSIASALVELLEDENLYMALSKNALERGRAMHTESWAEQYYRLYRS